MLNRESRETEERKKSIIKRVFPCALKLVRISGLMFRPFLYSSRLSFFVWQFFELTSFLPSFVGLTLHRRKKRHVLCAYCNRRVHISKHYVRIGFALEIFGCLFRASSFSARFLAGLGDQVIPSFPRKKAVPHPRE